jgi:hypothetical protein
MPVIIEEGDPTEIIILDVPPIEVTVEERDHLARRDQKAPTPPSLVHRGLLAHGCHRRNGELQALRVR